MPVLVQSEAFSYNPAATFFRVFFSPPVGRSLLLFTPLSVYTPVQHMQSNGVFPPTTTTPHPPHTASRTSRALMRAAWFARVR